MTDKNKRLFLGIKTISRDKDKYYITIKELNHQENIAILTAYVPKYRNQNTRTTTRTDRFERSRQIHIYRDFKLEFTPVFVISRISK